MRVSGGKGRGTRLKAPSGAGVRPTSDKVKQALFNILGERVAGARFLDLFGGAGGIGIEALSRGAEKVVFVDSSRESCALIRQNLGLTGFAESAEVVAMKAESYIAKPGFLFDIIFLDPPYRMELGPLLTGVAASPLLKPGGIVIAEHFKKQASPAQAGALVLYREAVYGDTVLAFYRVEES